METIEETGTMYAHRLGRVMALSLWQPWASLVAEGVKTIETRSWSTEYRGPLAIHAAKTTKGFDELPGDCEGSVEGGWHYGYIGDFQAGYCFRSSDEGKRGDTFLVGGNDGGPHRDIDIRPPLGVVVAIATLVDVAPIGGPYSFRTGTFQGDEGDFPGQAVVVHHPDCGRGESLVVDDGSVTDVSEQLPYGDYTSGRYAWLFEDIKPILPVVPARGRQQLWPWDARAED